MASKTIFIGGKEMLTAHGIADYFGVSLSTVQNWERMGKIKLERDYTDSSRGTRFILPQELEKLKKIETVRPKKAKAPDESKKMLMLLKTVGITTVEQLGAFIFSKQSFTQPTQPARDVPAARFDDTMSTPEAPAMLLNDTADEPEYTYWVSETVDGERFPIEPDSVDMMFEAWIESPSHPEITCRADVNVNNGIEAVKGSGQLLWTSEV